MRKKIRIILIHFFCDTCALLMRSHWLIGKKFIHFSSLPHSWDSIKIHFHKMSDAHIHIQLIIISMWSREFIENPFLSIVRVRVWIHFACNKFLLSPHSIYGSRFLRKNFLIYSHHILFLLVNLLTYEELFFARDGNYFNKYWKLGKLQKKIFEKLFSVKFFKYFKNEPFLAKPPHECDFSSAHRTYRNSFVKHTALSVSLTLALLPSKKYMLKGAY